jgi:hypothetical protein
LPLQRQDFIDGPNTVPDCQAGVPEQVEEACRCALHFVAGNRRVAEKHHIDIGMRAQLIPAIASCGDDGAKFLEWGRNTLNKCGREGFIGEERKRTRSNPAIRPLAVLRGNGLSSCFKELPDTGCGRVHGQIYRLRAGDSMIARGYANLYINCVHSPPSPFEDTMEQQVPFAQPQDTTPMSMKDWFITLLISYIPLVGLIMLIIWAFDSNTNVNKKNWA